MQIESAFIKKICDVLQTKCTDFKQSYELQYLALALLREVMATPINEEEQKKMKIIE